MVSNTTPWLLAPPANPLPVLLAGSVRAARWSRLRLGLRCLAMAGQLRSCLFVSPAEESSSNAAFDHRWVFCNPRPKALIELVNKPTLAVGGAPFPRKDL